FRFFVEFFKENQSLFEQNLFLNMGQLLSIPFVMIGIYFLFRKDKKVIKLQ
ncbi:MAG: prolipoprotein diacylglyceryl transferase family protein, partial [Bacteroidota bacterium]